MKSSLLIATTVACLICMIAFAEPSIDPNTILKIAVFESGRIEVDGAEVTTSEVETRIKKLKDQNGTVLFFAEALGEKPNKKSAEILSLIMKANLPVSISKRPDFSDISEEGNRLVKIENP